MDVSTRVAPLGLRFWDEVEATLVRDGLEVWAWPVARADKRTRASVNTAGVWGLQGLWGMADFERGRGDDEYWAAVELGTDPVLGAQRPFVVEVNDRSGRFLPVRWQIALPQRGVYQWPSQTLVTATQPLSEIAPPGAVPLFSHPRRPTAGVAQIRAELEDAASHAAASGALAELWLGELLLARGLSDTQGRLLLAFAYPELSPLPSGASTSLSDVEGPRSTWRWAAELRLYSTAAAASAADAPDLLGVFSQPEALALARENPELPLGEISFGHGEALVLRTLDSHLGRLAIKRAA